MEGSQTLRRGRERLLRRRIDVRAPPATPQRFATFTSKRRHDISRSCASDPAFAFDFLVAGGRISQSPRHFFQSQRNSHRGNGINRCEVRRVPHAPARGLPERSFKFETEYSCPLSRLLAGTANYLNNGLQRFCAHCAPQERARVARKNLASAVEKKALLRIRQTQCADISASAYIVYRKRAAADEPPHQTDDDYAPRLDRRRDGCDGFVSGYLQPDTGKVTERSIG